MALKVFKSSKGSRAKSAVKVLGVVDVVGAHHHVCFALVDSDNVLSQQATSATQL